MKNLLILLAFSNTPKLIGSHKFQLVANNKLTSKEQLRRLLKEKGLYINEIEELESYIAFKLSQH